MVGKNETRRSCGEPEQHLAFPLWCDGTYAIKSRSSCRGDHREFAMASGEMSETEYLAFNLAWMNAFLPVLADGAIMATFIDWRGYPVVHTAATRSALTPLNLVVWTKTNAGMGSLYRSQHELLPLFKKGVAPHVNNVELGRKGRWRSNVWTYAGASSLGSDSRRGLQDHLRVLPEAGLSLGRISHPKIRTNPKNQWGSNGAYATPHGPPSCRRLADHVGSRSIPNRMRGRR